MTRVSRSKGGVPGLLALGKNGLFGPYTTATELDVDKAALHASDPLVEPASTNLSTFSLNGGKLIFFHGDSDPWFSPLDTLGYYQSLAATNGGAEKVAEWSRHRSLCPEWLTAAAAPLSTTSTCSVRSSSGSRRAPRPTP